MPVKFGQHYHNNKQRVGAISITNHGHSQIADKNRNK